MSLPTNNKKGGNKSGKNQAIYHRAVGASLQHERDCRDRYERYNGGDKDGQRRALWKF